MMQTIGAEGDQAKIVILSLPSLPMFVVDQMRRKHETNSPGTAFDVLNARVMPRVLDCSDRVLPDDPDT